MNGRYNYNTTKMMLRKTETTWMNALKDLTAMEKYDTKCHQIKAVAEHRITHAIFQQHLHITVNE